MRAVITPERALAIQKLAATFKSDTARPLKVFQRMLGLMAAASPVLQLGLLRMRPLQRWLNLGFHTTHGVMDACISG